MACSALPWWESWLAAQHSLQAEAWLRIAKRTSGIACSRPGSRRSQRLRRTDVGRRPYESQRTAAVPPDLVAALTGNARANAAFERLGRSDRYGVILPLLKPRTPETRARMLALAVARLAAQKYM